MQPIDILINPSWVMPVEPDNTLLEDHAIAINAGKIVEILPKTAALQKYQANKSCDLPGHVAMPGLINAHTHSPMALLRGIANDLPLMTWLNDYVWPAERLWLSEEYIRDGMHLALAEMIRSGTTCFNEHYYFPEIMSEVTANAGMRASIGGTILEFPTAWAKNSQVAIEKAIEFIEQYKNHPLISPTLAPHAPYTVNDETLKRIKEIADKYNIPIHMHVHETDSEIQMSLQEYNKRPLKRLDDLGILSDKFQCVHMTQAEEEDIEILRKTQAHVINCPESNCKLTSGFCPAQKLLNAKVNVALGTDSAVSNNDLDMIGEMHSAALVTKGIDQDPTALPATESIRMATINSAKALGLDKKIGSLLPGKEADIIAIDLAELNTMPLYDIPAQIVYATNSRQVTNSWIAGKQVLNNRELVTLNKQEIIEKAKKWGKKIAEKQELHFKNHRNG